MTDDPAATPDDLAAAVDEVARALTLDGNAVAGLLAATFGSEMTDVASRCGHCGNVGAMGTLVAYTQAPGVILRCSVCTEVVLRVVQTPTGTLVDARGAAYLRLPAGDIAPADVGEASSPGVGVDVVAGPAPAG